MQESPYCIMTALFNAFRGRLEAGYTFCGSNAWRCDRITSVRELIETLKAEYRKAVGAAE